MNLKNGEIFNAIAPLQKLVDREFPVKVSYGLAKMANKLNEQFKVIDQVRQGLIKKYGVQEGQQISVKADGPNFPKFIAELEELMNQEVEVVFEKVKLPEEVDGKPLQIEPKILMALEKFVEV